MINCPRMVQTVTIRNSEEDVTVKCNENSVFGIEERINILQKELIYYKKNIHRI
jgi:hypothetical protein